MVSIRRPHPAKQFPAALVLGAAALTLQLGGPVAAGSGPEAPREVTAARLFGPVETLNGAPHVRLSKVVEALRGRLDFVEQDHLYRLTPGLGGPLEYDPTGLSLLGRIQLAPARGTDTSDSPEAPRIRSLVVGDKGVSRDVRMHNGLPYVPLQDLAKAMGRRLQPAAGGLLMVLEEGVPGAPAPSRPVLRVRAPEGLAPE